MPPTPTNDIVEIDVTDEIDRWQYTCPHGHTLGKINNYSESYYCPSCSRAHSITTTTWTYIIDQRINQNISFSDVEYHGD